MNSFHPRLFFRIAFKSKEVYLLKILTLSVAFACSSLITIFSISEFGYDRFHDDHHLIFRILQRDNREHYVGNRLSNGIPEEIFSSIKSNQPDSVLVSRVKVLDELNVLTTRVNLSNQKLYATGPELITIFSFHILKGSLKAFKEKSNVALLSSSLANEYFGNDDVVGSKLNLFTFGDTVTLTIAGVYEDFPINSHEGFKGFIQFDNRIIHQLHYNPEDFGVYGKLLNGNFRQLESGVNAKLGSAEIIYKVQPITEIYFGPRVDGEDANHGDQYSILILISITGLILFLALTSYINLTTLTLPNRSKELAVKKMAGTSQANLMLSFLFESFLVVGVSLLAGVLILILVSSWIQSVLSIDLIALLKHGNALFIGVLACLLLVLSLAPVFMTFSFSRATPNKLLGEAVITFPRFKRIILFLQLGISIFLIVASMVIRRQVNYSLVKEPGRNYDQVVYLSYPSDLTGDGLRRMREGWKKYNPNILDVIATSQLPNNINSKELDSKFYYMLVDPEFKDFFNLNIEEGYWFGPNDGDTTFVVNGLGKKILGSTNNNMVGVYRDFNGRFNQPEKPTKLKTASYLNYNFLCIRILEVDFRRTIHYLTQTFGNESYQPKISFLDKHFEAWVQYQDKLNSLSEVLASISLLLSCLAIYGLSISMVRDKLKQIAIHKLCGAGTLNITYLLIREFILQMIVAILISGPITYLALKELLRSFAYSAPFQWLDPVLPVAFCAFIIILLCGFQAAYVNREDLTSSLKG